MRYTTNFQDKKLFAMMTFFITSRITAISYSYQIIVHKELSIMCNWLSGFEKQCKFSNIGINWHNSGSNNQQWANLFRMLTSEFTAHSHLSDTSSLENTYGHPKGALCQYKTNFLNQLNDMHNIYRSILSLLIILMAYGKIYYSKVWLPGRDSRTPAGQGG